MSIFVRASSRAKAYIRSGNARVRKIKTYSRINDKKITVPRGSKKNVPERLKQANYLHSRLNTAAQRTTGGSKRYQSLQKRKNVIYSYTAKLKKRK